MQEPSTFEHAYEAFRSQVEIAPPASGAPSNREGRLRDILTAQGLAPRVTTDGTLHTRFRGWEIGIAAPDDDPQWTVLMGRVDPDTAGLSPEATYAAIARVNGDLKCAQAVQFDGAVMVTVGLLTDSEPSPSLLRRAFRIMADAMKHFVENE